MCRSGSNGTNESSDAAGDQQQRQRQRHPRASAPTSATASSSASVISIVAMRRILRGARRHQKREPGCARNAASSGVDARPRMALRCGIAAEAEDHVGVLLRPLERRRVAHLLRRARRTARASGAARRRPRRARTACTGTSGRTGRARGRSRARRRLRAVASARASPANARGVSRKMLRVNWSSSSTRASAPRAVVAPFAEAAGDARSSTASPKRWRIASSKAASLRNHTSCAAGRARASRARRTRSRAPRRRSVSMPYDSDRQAREERLTGPRNAASDRPICTPAFASPWR